MSKNSLERLTELTKGRYTHGYSLFRERILIKISQGKKHMDRVRSKREGSPPWSLFCPILVESEHFTLLTSMCGNKHRELPTRKNQEKPGKLTRAFVSSVFIGVSLCRLDGLIKYPHGWSQSPGWQLTNTTRSKASTLNIRVGLAGVATLCLLGEADPSLKFDVISLCPKQRHSHQVWYRLSPQNWQGQISS